MRTHARRVCVLFLFVRLWSCFGASFAALPFEYHELRLEVPDPGHDVLHPGIERRIFGFRTAHDDIGFSTKVGNRLMNPDLESKCFILPLSFFGELPALQLGILSLLMKEYNK